MIHYYLQYIINTKTVKSFNLKKFINIYNVEKSGKTKIILYKSVTDSYKDFHNGTINYKVGTTVTCPDWNNEFTGECGYGLHLCGKPEQTQTFNKGKILKCEVAIKDIVVHNNPKYPTKVRCRKVKVLEEVKL